MRLSRVLRAMQFGITTQSLYVGFAPPGTRPALSVYAPLSSTSVLLQAGPVNADFRDTVGGIVGCLWLQIKSLLILIDKTISFLGDIGSRAQARIPLGFGGQGYPSNILMIYKLKK